MMKIVKNEAQVEEKKNSEINQFKFVLLLAGYFILC